MKKFVIFEIGIGFYPSEQALIFGNYLVFSLGKKVNAKSINCMEKFTCTFLILPYSLFSIHLVDIFLAIFWRHETFQQQPQCNQNLLKIFCENNF